ncbi:alpha/beta fold hydrolase [Ferrimicrobium acidiphilum]|uniref:alpha/beta fold hydrolase n=1 Tax=Ferrimicrobium acidiphilum TaxID=121039 RepID=UPI0023F5069A|nr:alpha/beta hydrolase [Ferrimicrobium acidiphilum]
MSTLSTLHHDTATLEVAGWMPNGELRGDLEIVLLHEGLGCVAMWKQFPQQLADRIGVRVVAYSRAGYGGSSSVELPRPLDYMQREADEVLPSLLAKLSPRPRVIVGHSDGATIALAYAGSHRDELLAGVVAIAPHVITEDVTIASIERAKYDFLQGDLAQRLARYHGANLSTAFWGWNDVWLDPDFRTFSILDRLDNIDIPLLVIQGTEDNYGSMTQLELIQSRVPSAVIAPIDGANHSPHLSHPNYVMSRLENFFEREICVPSSTSERNEQ